MLTMDSNGSSNSTRQRPKLDRRNAMKNITYDAVDDTSSPTSSALRQTRSLDLHNHNHNLSDSHKSFRIEGINDGEFDLICRSLGFSGPEDFAIPTAIWEEQKARSRSCNFDSPSSFSSESRFVGKVRVFDVDSSKHDDDEVVSLRNDVVNDSVVSNSTKHAVNGSLMLNNKGGINNTRLENGLDFRENVDNVVLVNKQDRIKEEISGSSKSNKENGDKVSDEREIWDSKLRERVSLVSVEVSRGVARDGGNGGGVKGERPPLLVPPPPGRLQPVIDNTSSTWDIFNSFAPRVNEDLVTPVQVGFLGPLSDNVGVIKGNEVLNGGIIPEEKSNGLLLAEQEPGGVSVPEDGTLADEDKDEEVTGGMFNLILESEYNISIGRKFRRTITSWQKGELLGSGSFGTVYEAYTDDGYFFAVKEVSLLDQGCQGKQSIFQLEQEISLLSQFEHENIVQYLGTDKADSKLYIFLELVTKGSLLNLYQKYNLKDSQVSAYTRQILSGLKYLHDRNVVHRDIKCANILVDVSGSVKLADFGLAKATKMNDIKSSKGSPYWMAPEVVNNRNRGYGLAADIWSLGCTVLEMLTRQPPYSHLEGMQALFRIGKGEPPPIPDSLSADARDFIVRCIQVNPSSRPTAAELLEHPFVKRPPSTPVHVPSPLHPRARS